MTSVSVQSPSKIPFKISYRSTQFTHTQKNQTKQIAKAILNKNNDRGIAIFDFKLYYRT